MSREFPSSLLLPGATERAVARLILAPLPSSGGCGRQRGTGSRAPVCRGRRSQVWVLALGLLIRGPAHPVSTGWGRPWRGSDPVKWSVVNFTTITRGQAKKEEVLLSLGAQGPPPTPLPVSQCAFRQAHVHLAFSPCIENGQQPFVFEACLLPHYWILSVFSPWLLWLHRQLHCHYQERQMRL